MKPIAPEEVPALVDAELRRVLGEGWTIARTSPTTWDVEPPPGLHDVWAPRCIYGVLALGAHVIVTHGNSDAGALSLGRLAQQSSLVTVGVHPLGPWTLGDALRSIFDAHPPNLYGLT